MSILTMFDYRINALVYVVAFVVITYCVRAARFTRSSGSDILSFLGVIAYLGIFGAATVIEYKLQHEIDVVFKNSVSPWREFLTRNDLSEMRDYFHRLDIPTPSEGPVIGINWGGECGSAVNAKAHPAISRMDIEIGSSCLVREQMTLLYSQNVIWKLTDDRKLQTLKMNQAAVVFVANGVFYNYFNWSFWDNPNLDIFCPGSDALGGWAHSLWRIREKLGSNFTDKMTAFAVRIMADDPRDGMDNEPHVLIYLARQLKKGDSVIDDGKKNWPIILEILKEDGVNVDKI